LDVIIEHVLAGLGVGDVAEQLSFQSGYQILFGLDFVGDDEHLLLQVLVFSLELDVVFV